MSAADEEGPYLGLRTYEEADANRYFGREDIVAEVARMVTRAPLTVLFGVSGTGKSSMIRAGVFPIVRENQILPILIRLGFSKGHPELTTQVRHAIATEITAHQIDAKPPSDEEPLHEYFARNPFWTVLNQLVTPLLVFDQFEEIFTISQDRVAQVEALMKLAILADRVPRALAAEREIVAPRPRMMFVLREDFLAHLEDYRPILPALVGNRYRLTRMNGEQALQAVMNPGGKLITEDTARKVVRFVASGADAIGNPEEPRPLETLEVEPAILSLVCQQLDLLRRRLSLPQITPDLITSQGGKIVEKFYDSAFEGLPDETRALVEDVLVTSDGYRTTMSKAAALETEGVTKESIEKLLSEKILREEIRFGSLHIELIHDRLTKIASQSRARRRDNAREEERSRRLWRRATIVAGAIVVLFAIAGIAFYLYVDKQHREEAENVRRAREMATQASVEKQALELASFLLRDARDALQRGDAPHAASRVQQTKSYFAQAGRRPTPEAELVYKRALVEIVGRVQTVDNGAEIDCVSAIDAERMLTCGRDGVLRIWKDNRIDKEIADPGYGPIYAAYPDRGGNWVLVLHENGSGEIRRLTDTVAPLTFEAPGSKAINVQQWQPPATPIEPLPTLPLPAPAPNAAAQRVQKPLPKWRACVAPDDSAFAIWAPDLAGVRLWAMPQGKRIGGQLLDTARPAEVQCLEKGRLVLRTGDAWTVVAAGGTLERSGTFQTSLGPLVVSSSGSLLATVFAPSSYAGVELSIGNRHPFIRTLRPRTAQLSPDGRLLVVTSELADHTVFVGAWSIPSGDRGFSIDRPAAAARLVTSGEATYLVVASDRRVEAWDTRDWRFLGSAGFDFDLTSARIDARTSESGIVIVAAGRRIASQRNLALEPSWADAPLVTLPGVPQSWALASPSDWLMRRSPVLKVDASLVILTDALNRPLARLPDPTGAIVDATISTEVSGGAGAPVRIAVLRRDGVVTLYDDHFTVLAERVGDTAVRAIRWSGERELITLGWNRIQIWTADGKLTSTVETAAEDARLLVAPRRVLWSCVATQCTAWDPATQEQLSSVALEGTRSPILGPFDSFLRLDSQRSLLLPIVRDGDHDLHAMRELTTIAGQLIVRNAAGASFLLGGSPAANRLGRSIVVGTDTSDLIVANGASLAIGTAVEHTGNRARHLWTAAAPVIAMHVQGRKLAVIDAELGTTLLDLEDHAKVGPRVEAAGAVGPGSHATFSTHGDRYAYVSAGGSIEVRDSDSGSALGRYESADLEIRSLLVGSTKSPVVVALADRQLAVWKASGKPQLISTVYERVVMDDAGKYLVGLRLDGKAEIRDTSWLDKIVMTVPARAIAIDEAGTRVAADNGKTAVDIYKLDKLTKGKTSQPLRRRSTHGLRFSPDGTYLWIEDPDETDSRIVRSGAGNVKASKPRDCVFSVNANIPICLYEGPSGLTIQPMNLDEQDTAGRLYPISRAPEGFFGCSGPAGTFVAAGLSLGEFTSIFLWNPKLSSVEPRRIPAKGVTACRFTKDGLATITDAGLFELWNPISGGRIDARGGAMLLASTLAANGTVVAAIGLPGHGAVAQVVTGAKAVPTALPAGGDIVFATFAGDRELVAVVPGASGEQILAWRLPIGTIAPRTLDPKLGQVADATKSSITALTTIGNASYVAAGFGDGTVRLWSAESDDPAAVLAGYGAAAKHVVVDDADRWIAISYDDGTVSLWELHPAKATEPTEKREALIRLDARGRAGGAPAITFQTYNGAPTLVTGSIDGQLERWALGGDLPRDADQLIKRALREAQFGVR